MASIPTPILVAAVAMIDPSGQILLQKRKAGSHHGGLWEFPGGKLDAGESFKMALVREIAEELGVNIAARDLFYEGQTQEALETRLSHTRIVMKLYSCAKWRGEPRCLDADTIGWFSVAEAALLAVPPLDRPFIARLGTIVAAAGSDLV